MDKLLSFHNDPKIKEKYIARVKEHAEHDAIVKGQYWEEGKGCAVGCTIEGSDHSKYETELGIPSQIAYMEDSLFEALPNELAMTFPLRFLEAVPVGADLSLVTAKLMVWQFEDEKYGIKHLKPVQEDKELLKVCEDVVDAYKRILNGEEVSDKEWESLYARASEGEARAWAGAWARAWAVACAWAGAGADFNALYVECLITTSEKLLELLAESNHNF